jgi:signal transduction histidine kinase
MTTLWVRAQQRWAQRPRWLTQSRIDVVIALVLLIELELESWLDTVVPGPHRLGAALASVLLVAPVAVRRRWPGGALVTCAAVTGVLQGPPFSNVLNGMTGVILPLLLLAFTAGTRLDLRRGLGAAVAAAALIAGGAVWSTAGPPTGYSLGSELVSAAGLPLLLWAFGWMWRERSRRAAAFGALATRLERERRQHERAAVSEERMRIGRELHDIIAQNVSAIIIQAGGARQLIGADPARASDAILAVERTGREALADLRRALGLLRADDDPRELAPQPGLAQLGNLLEMARGRGLDIALRKVGEPGGLTTGVDLLGYRVIEAALLGANRNRQPTDLTLDYGRSRLTIEIRGQGPANGLDERLHGISERIALYDGTLAVRRANAEAFSISVQLPREVPGE